MRSFIRFRLIFPKIPGGIVGILCVFLIASHFNQIKACPGQTQTQEHSSSDGSHHHEDHSVHEESSSSSSSNSSNWSSSSWSNSSEWSSSGQDTSTGEGNTLGQSDSFTGNSSGQNNANGENNASEQINVSSGIGVSSQTTNVLEYITAHDASEVNTGSGDNNAGGGQISNEQNSSQQNNSSGHSSSSGWSNFSEWSSWSEQSSSWGHSDSSEGSSLEGQQSSGHNDDSTGNQSSGANSSGENNSSGGNNSGSNHFSGECNSGSSSSSDHSGSSSSGQNGSSGSGEHSSSSSQSSGGSSSHSGGSSSSSSHSESSTSTGHSSSSHPGGSNSDGNHSDSSSSSGHGSSSGSGSNHSSGGSHSESDSSSGHNESSGTGGNSSGNNHSSGESNSESNSSSSSHSGSSGSGGNSSQNNHSSGSGNSSGHNGSSGSEESSAGSHHSTGGSTSTGHSGSSESGGSHSSGSHSSEGSHSGGSHSTGGNHSGSSTSTGHDSSSGSEGNSSGGNHSSGANSSSSGHNGLSGSEGSNHSSGGSNSGHSSSGHTGSSGSTSGGSHSTGGNHSGSNSSSGHGSSSVSGESSTGNSHSSTGSSSDGNSSSESGHSSSGSGTSDENGSSSNGSGSSGGNNHIGGGDGVFVGGGGAIGGEIGGAGPSIYGELEGGVGIVFGSDGSTALEGAGGVAIGQVGGGSATSGEDSSANDLEIILTDAELEHQIIEMEKFLIVQMEAPGGWNNTDQSTKANASSHGIPDLAVFRQIFTGFGENVKRDSVCAGCQVYTGVLMHQINRRNESRENLENFALFTCRFFRLAHPDVCQGLITRLSPTFYWIVKQRKGQLSPQEFCGVTLQSLGCRISKRKQQNSEFNWEVDPQQYVPITGGGGSGGGGSVNQEEDQPDPTDDVESFTPLSIRREDNQPLKILHLADLHIDPEYAVGTDAECENEVLCCQERFGWPNSTEVGAGYYGDNRRCDAPMKMLHLTLRQIQRQHPDIDLIYMTGDLVPHNIWYTEQEENEHIIQIVSKTLLDYFPNTRIVPCLGNHEAHPVNLYSPTSRQFEPPESNPIPRELRQDWLYESTYEAWKQWIPSAERENFLKAGYFVVELNSKMRAIVVNTNVCYGFNLWQTYNPRDPGDMLRWFQNELYVTQKEGKTAHIIGHVPPGHEDCTKTWSREFYKIVARYKHVIRGQFYGHTHYDEFRILHDPENKTEPISMMWIGPSLTPYRIYNPGYRIYHMDGADSTYGNIVDHETWIYDLEKSNEIYRQMYGENGTHEASQDEDDRYVQWFQLYQATKAYGIPNVLPESMRAFVYMMARDQVTFDTFYMHYFKAIDSSFLEKEPCDTVCKKRILCGIVRSYYDDDEGHQECNSVQKEVDGIVLPLRTLDLKRRFIWL